jgi:hypothetical protein
MKLGQFAVSEIDHEEFEERAATIEFDGRVDRVKAEKMARHECEIRWCLRNFYPDGVAMKAHFDACEKKRGKAATDMLRADVRKAWVQRGGRPVV